MKKILLYTCVVLAMAQLAPDVFGQIDREREKRGQSGLQFLDISINPRAAAMGDALSAVDLNSSVAMFYNPATMARLEGISLGFGTAQWFADINYSNASMAISPANGRFGVFGVSVIAVDYGELEGTIIDGDPAGPGYIETANFSPSALAIGIGYAKALSDRFSIGGNLRYAHQDLGDSQMTTDGDMQENTVNAPVADFGVLYNTGFRSLNLAVTARNFSPAVTYEAESFEAPLSLNIGMSMNLLDVLAPSATGDHAFLMAVEAGHPRSYAEQIRLGGEYQFMDLLFLRAGYTFPTDEQGINLGGGLNLGVGNFRISADYAFSQFGDLGNVNRIGLQVGF